VTSRDDIKVVVRASDGGTLIDVWVVPGASRTEIAGVHDGALRVRVAPPAEGGKANRALLRLFSKVTGAPALLERGTTSRRKQVRVAGRSAEAIAAVLAAHLEMRRGS
jgi:hypothetical protein